jgi:hypothetical protein
MVIMGCIQPILDARHMKGFYFDRNGFLAHGLLFAEMDLADMVLGRDGCHPFAEFH